MISAHDLSIVLMNSNVLPFTSDKHEYFMTSTPVGIIKGSDEHDVRIDEDLAKLGYPKQGDIAGQIIPDTLYLVLYDNPSPCVCLPDAIATKNGRKVYFYALSKKSFV